MVSAYLANACPIRCPRDGKRRRSAKGSAKPKGEKGSWIPMYEFHSWSKQRCEEAFGEAQRRSVANRAKGDRGTRFELRCVGSALSGGMRGPRGYRLRVRAVPITAA